MGFVAFKEIGKLESKLDVLSDAILNYSANENEPNVQLYKDTLEKKDCGNVYCFAEFKQSVFSSQYQRLLGANDEGE